MKWSAIAFTAACCTQAAFGSPEINWYSFDSGGGVSSGGTYTLRSVIGQPDAGPLMMGGAYAVRGGFLTGFEPEGCSPADLAPPFGIIDLSDINVFVSGFITGDPIADLDGSGVFDLTDINQFIDSFVAGCP